MKLATFTTVDGRTMLRCYTQGQLIWEKEITRPELARLFRELSAAL